MEQTPSPQVSKHVSKKKSNKALRVIPWVGLVLFVVTIAAGVYLYATKQLVLAINSTATPTIVCGDAIVNTYNKASRYVIPTTKDIGVDSAGLDALDKDMRTKADFEKDPTCQTIIFWHAIINSDVAKAKTALTAIEKLHDTHQYADTNLIDTTSLTSMRDSLSAMSADATKS